MPGGSLEEVFLKVTHADADGERGAMSARSAACAPRSLLIRLRLRQQLNAFGGLSPGCGGPSRQETATRTSQARGGWLIGAWSASA